MAGKAKKQNTPFIPTHFLHALPWKVNRAREESTRYSVVEILTEVGGHGIANMVQSLEDKEVELAKYIVKAANNHEQLLALLKRAAAYIGQTVEYKIGHAGADALMKESVAAIAKAEGR